MKTIILVALMTAWLIEHLLVFINSLILLGTPRKRDLQKPTPTPSLVGGGGQNATGTIGEKAHGLPPIHVKNVRSCM